MINSVWYNYIIEGHISKNDACAVLHIMDEPQEQQKLHDSIMESTEKVKTHHELLSLGRMDEVEIERKSFPRFLEFQTVHTYIRTQPRTWGIPC
jgi:hypothetical protein